MKDLRLKTLSRQCQDYFKVTAKMRSKIHPPWKEDLTPDYFKTISRPFQHYLKTHLRFFSDYLKTLSRQLEDYLYTPLRLLTDSFIWLLHQDNLNTTLR